MIFFRDSKVEINRKEFNSELSHFVRKVQYNRGFTLVELLIVVAIVGLLAVMVSLGFQDFIEKAKIARATEEIRSLEKEIIAYSTDKASYPPLLDDIGRQSLKDPWGNLYVYDQLCPPADGCSREAGGSPLNTDFDLYSKGANGATDPSIFHDDSLDDIIRGKNGSFANIALKWGL
jgi:general secretion pathway protein G